MFSLVKRRLRSDQTATHNYLRSSYKDKEAKLFCKWQTITKAKGHRLWLANFQMCIKEKNLFRGNRLPRVLVASLSPEVFSTQ